MSRLILFTRVPDSSKAEEIALAGLTLEKEKKQCNWFKKQLRQWMMKCSGIIPLGTKGELNMVERDTSSRVNISCGSTAGFQT